MPYQPIETAPTDGTPILLVYAESQFKPAIQTGSYNPDKYATSPKPFWHPDGMRHTRGLGWCRKNNPIAWMPIPEFVPWPK